MIINPATPPMTPPTIAPTLDFFLEPVVDACAGVECPQQDCYNVSCAVDMNNSPFCENTPLGDGAMCGSNGVCQANECVVVVGQASTTGSKKKSNVGAIVGGVIGGVAYALKNPNQGYLEVEDMDHEQVMEVITPLLGDCVGAYTDWTPLIDRGKFFDDHYYNNAYYAKVGGVTYSEMNALEVEFLFMLNFDLFVTTETYKQYYDELWNHANNSTSHLCGCNNAKVPLLILPRFDEPRKNPIVLNESDLIDKHDLDFVDD